LLGGFSISRRGLSRSDAHLFNGGGEIVPIVPEGGRESGLNGIGLIASALLTVAVSVLPLGVLKKDWVMFWVAFPFAVLGGVGLADDLLNHDRLAKKLLGIE